jgi:DNA-binding PadR family transcriptional regulator
LSSDPEKIAIQWREQMQKGYLKLAALFVLTREPLHGYEMMKRISEWTLGMITPTAGGLYPTLKELERKDLIKGEWVPEQRRKVYHITEQGREVFQEAVGRHFKLASSIRQWFFKELSDLGIMNQKELPEIMEPAIKVLLLKENASPQERIEALEKLRERLQHLTLMLHQMIDQINLREKELRQTEQLEESLESASHMEG